MISLDTNVVVRFLLNDIPAQTKKAEQLIENEKVYVTDVVVAEVIYVLENAINLPRKDVADLMKDFLAFANVTHNPYFLDQTIAMYETHPALSIVDCYAVVEAEVYGHKLVSFDKKLVSQGGPHVSLL